MKRFFILLGMVALVALGFWATTAPDATVAGLAVACAGNEDPTAPCWIATGGFGIISLGMGAGLVEIGILGAGLLFATGQLSFGLIAFGQLAVGPVFFCGQVGVGLTGLGQGGIGLYKVTQDQTSGKGRRFLDQLGGEINELLTFR